MEKKIKVLLADNSEAFGIPCAAAMRSHSLDVETVEKTDGRLWTRSPISNPMW